MIAHYNDTHTEQLPDIPLHGLRHTSATLLISQNVDVRTVSNRLGHAQTSTTMNIYSHSLQKKDVAASNALTSATLLISQNVDVRTVSNRLGHAQTSTTMNIYSHSLQKKDVAASNALEELLIKKSNC